MAVVLEAERRQELDECVVAGQRSEAPKNLAAHIVLGHPAHPNAILGASQQDAIILLWERSCDYLRLFGVPCRG